MTNVHLEISKKVQEKVDAIAKYREMDNKREEIIANLVDEYQQTGKVDLTSLNQWTERMNSFAQKNAMPIRKTVSLEMFIEYVNTNLDIK